MKLKFRRRCAAFTYVELCVVVVVLGLLAVMARLSLDRMARAHVHSGPTCMNNLKQFGIAYRLWADDNVGSWPAQISTNLGGWKEYLADPGQGSNCWRNYTNIAPYIGNSPRVVLCYKDTRTMAHDLGSNFNNLNVSYFVGVGASADYPQSIIGGDRNLGPGGAQDPQHGYSLQDGKGNDVALSLSGSYSWSVKMHSGGPGPGGGNILLGDGSGQQTTSATFSKVWLPKAAGTNNWPVGHVPAVPSIRLVFP